MDQWVWVHLQLIWPFRGHLEELAAAVADRLVFMITEITPVKAYHETENLPHSGCFIGIFLCTDWMSEFSVTEAFYAQLKMVVDLCPKGYNLIVLGDFNANTGTDRDGFQSCVGPHGSGSRRINEALKAPPCSLSLRKVGD